MKNRILYSVFIVSILSLVSCNNKEGCRDSNALNYDSSAKKDGTCSYTKAIFYAPSNQIGGTSDLVVKIEIYLGPTPGQELIGTINTFSQTEPVNCVAPQGAFEYELPSSDVEYIFITQYYYENNTNEAGDTHLIQAKRDKNCETIQLTQ